MVLGVDKPDGVDRQRHRDYSAHYKIEDGHGTLPGNAAANFSAGLPMSKSYCNAARLSVIWPQLVRGVPKYRERAA
jgi:hypothetical protein